MKIAFLLFCYCIQQVQGLQHHIMYNLRCDKTKQKKIKDSKECASLLISTMVWDEFKWGKLIWSE